MKFSQINPDVPVSLYKSIMERSSLNEEEERITFGDFFEELKGANDQIEKFIEVSKKSAIEATKGDVCFPVQISLFLGLDKIELYTTDNEVTYVDTSGNDMTFLNGSDPFKFTTDGHRKLFYVDTLIFKNKSDAEKFIVMTKITFAGSKIEVKTL